MENIHDDKIITIGVHREQTLLYPKLRDKCTWWFCNYLKINLYFDKNNLWKSAFNFFKVKVKEWFQRFHKSFVKKWVLTTPVRCDISISHNCPFKTYTGHIRNKQVYSTRNHRHVYTCTANYFVFLPLLVWQKNFPKTGFINFLKLNGFSENENIYHKNRFYTSCKKFWKAVHRFKKGIYLNVWRS